MNVFDFLQIIVITIVAIWGIYQTRVTKNLEGELHRLNASLDQSIQILHRAREAVMKVHQAHVFLLNYVKYLNDEAFPNEVCATKHAELSAYKAELRGLAFSIGDKELLDLVNESYEFMKQAPEERFSMLPEMEIRGRSQRLHTRISQLLELATS